MRVKLIKEIAEVYHNKYIKGIYSIRIARYFIDSFGASYIEYKIWDEFVTKEIAERELLKLETKQAMRNCGYNVL